jgi:hypothetical protein
MIFSSWSLESSGALNRSITSIALSISASVREGAQLATSARRTELCLLQLPGVAVHRPDGVLDILAAGLQAVQGALYLLGEVAEFLEVGEEDLDLGALLGEGRSPLGDHYEKGEGCAMDGAESDMS